MSENAVEPARCLNCGARLSGQYCGECGQRASNRLISFWELVRDAFGDLFELDSRLWRTVRPLLLKPGLLTKDYLEGRRARYMPPFRMYLVLSLIFFVVAFFDPRDDLAILYEPEPAGQSVQDAGDIVDKVAESPGEKEQARRVLEELANEGILDREILDQDSPTGLVVGEAGEAGAEDINITINGNEMFGDCESGDWDVSGPAWLKRRMTQERFRQTCERLNAVGPAGVGRAVLDRVPAALLILLPAMAFILKLLYPLSRRYYVEHLLFFVHFHAFFFLILTLQVLWARSIAATPLSEAFGVLPIVASSMYIPIYLHKSMRRVYGQSGVVTFIKFLLLAVTYIVGFSLLMLTTLLLAVFSV